LIHWQQIAIRSRSAFLVVNSKMSRQHQAGFGEGMTEILMDPESTVQSQHLQHHKKS
jgi:hypothetical protein